MSAGSWVHSSRRVPRPVTQNNLWSWDKADDSRWPYKEIFLPELDLIPGKCHWVIDNTPTPPVLLGPEGFSFQFLYTTMLFILTRVRWQCCSYEINGKQLKGRIIPWTCNIAWNAPLFPFMYICDILKCNRKFTHAHIRTRTYTHTQSHTDRER